MADDTHSKLHLVINLGLNILNFIFLACASILLFSWSNFPLLIIRLCEISVAQYYRSVTSDEDTIVLEENDSPSTIGCVVGWREDPGLFGDCLRSLKKSDYIFAIVVGIDGDSDEDLEMEQICREVLPNSHRVYFPQPLGEIVELTVTLEEDLSQDEMLLNKVLARLLNFVRSSLLQQTGSKDLRTVASVCISQPHRCKKDIQFTSLLASIVLAKERGLDFIWGSDSDSIVQSQTIRNTVELLARSANNGGASARLRAFHKSATPVSKMVTAKYWFDQDVTRMQTAAFNSSECQPGPCSALRVEALEEVILPWYLQRLWGRKMITNEDRHLTTSLLHKGWHVQYASNALVLTETPNSAISWIKQQVRWSRGTHLERISKPIIYARQHAWFSLHVWQEQVLPVIACASIIEFILRSEMTFPFSMKDMILRTVIEFIYTLRTAVDPVTRKDLKWLLPALVIYNLIKPAVHIWAMATVFDSSWGITQINVGSVKVNDLRRKRWYEVGFCVVWLSLLAAFWAKALAEGVNYFYRDLLPGVLLSFIAPFLISPLLYWAFFRDLYGNCQE